MSRRRPLDGTTTRTRTRPSTTPTPRTHGRSSRSSRGAPTPPSTRAMPRRRLRAISKVLVLVVLVVASVAVAGQWLLRTSFFRVQQVIVVGAHHETPFSVVRASGLAAHPTMLGVSAHGVEQRLRAFTWISTVAITKRWPHSLVVTVRESKPVAVAYNFHHQLQYVDQYGRDLGVAPAATNLPTLQYLNPTSTTWPFARASASAAYVASQLPPAFSAQVAAISEGSSGIVTLSMTTPVSFILGPATQLHAKFVAIASVIAHTTLRPGDVVDVTVPDELAVSGPPPS